MPSLSCYPQVRDLITTFCIVSLYEPAISHHILITSYGSTGKPFYFQASKPCDNHYKLHQPSLSVPGNE